MQHFISCLNPEEWGCKYGNIDAAMRYLERNGVTSENCFPYSASKKQIEECRVTCKNNLPMPKYRCRRGSSRMLRSNQAIKEVVYKTGPVTVTYDVFQDFVNYKSGIYSYTSGALLGYHAVKILGWGKSDRGTEYYLI